MDRAIHLYAHDAHGHALPHSDFRLTTLDGQPRGEVHDSNGQASFQLDGAPEALRAFAVHDGATLDTQLGKSTDTWTFTFDTILEPTIMDLAKANIPAIVGGVLLAVALMLAFTFLAPTPLQSQLIRSTAALGLGGIASILTGMLMAQVTLGKQLAVTATGAAAVYVITYFFVPA